MCANIVFDFLHSRNFSKCKKCCLNLSLNYQRLSLYLWLVLDPSRSTYITCLNPRNIIRNCNFVFKSMHNTLISQEGHD